MAYSGNYYYTQHFGILYKFFREKKALSKEHAIILTEEDLLELGYPNGISSWYTGLNSMFKTFPIMKTDEGKYWFSVDAYKNYWANSMVLAFVIIAVIFILIPFIALIIPAILFAFVRLTQVGRLY